MDGTPVGLDYKSIESVLRLSGLPEEEHADCFDRVRILEAEVLSIFRIQHDERHKKTKPQTRRS